MKVYRVVDTFGNTVHSNRNLFSGLYDDKKDAERALAGMKGSWRARYGPYFIQESTDFQWNEEVKGDDTAPYHGS